MRRASTSADWFSHPDQDANIMSAWERMIEGSRPPASAVRAIIDASWHRCLDGRVDPETMRAPPPLEEGQLFDLRARNDQLMRASVPLIDQTNEFLSQTGTILLLTDPHGLILENAGDTRLLQPAGEIHLVPGCTWSEISAGTNAIGTALAVRRPVQIHGSEHFCAGIKRWTCSATVIHDPFDGTILGVLDVSGLARTYDRHSLAFIVSMAGRIEGSLGKFTMERRLRLMARCWAYCSGRAEGVIVVDDRGRLVRANPPAQVAFARLGISGALESAFPIPEIGRIAAGSPSPQGASWLRLARIETVSEGSEILGFMLIAPAVADRSVLLSDLTPTAASTPAPAFCRLIGSSPALCVTIQKAQQLARATVPVLLLGETGVGKELFARGIHEASTRAHGPFVALNCGSLSRDLLTSELFGYAEGAFTGARRSGMAGKIEAADGGTLFLDEIGEMPLDIQPHLLRVLEEGEVLRLGENTARKVNFRLIAATHRDLRAEIADGSFRADLYYRLAVTNIEIPPLRERKTDLPDLLEHWLSVSRDRFGVGNVVIDDTAFECLMNYAWPGNVRELRNAIEGAVLMACDGVIRIRDLPAEIHTPSVSAGAQDSPNAGASEAVPREVRSLDAVEAESIRLAIQKYRGDLTAAAVQLGIAKSTLYQKVAKYGLTDDIATARRKFSS
ncbi:sigma-54-dependent Fis family transcriptional regulator [Paraburkholderia sp. Cpub6]|uniref:sigma-54-dependent Fis family transcriptional regulator n=1 Tax=Paraburkholderia sp. Cpub6 TaxID=2723094 RepID=UPI0017A31300|nr:sigma-54-dependent Fis family transcriptional regulator [Paraburkholderia sp. Cpub6]MBB5462298.1 transcriptional regulator of acetoin/glycerol metabolism [Paraburkholderia sp. Cpub6]